MVNLYYQNVNRIRSKTNDFLLNLTSSNYDIICLTETNLDDGIYDNEVFDSRYNVFRRDRCSTSVALAKTDGGGVLIAVKKQINVVRQKSWESDVEDIWVSVVSDENNALPLHICTCYLPPDLPFEDLNKFYKKVQHNILNSYEIDNFLILGDFNCPPITWTRSPNRPVLLPSNHHDRKSNLLIDTINTCNLEQYQNIPNHNGRLLDLVFSSMECINVYGAEVLSRLDRHHPSFVVDIPKITIKKALKNNPKKHLQFQKCNLNEIKLELRSINWYETLYMEDVDQCVDAFYDKLNSIIQKHTPLSNCDSHKYPIWYNSSLKHCLKEKNKYHKLYKTHGNPRDYDTFSMLRARCKFLTRKCYDKFIESVEDSLDESIKAFWTFINSRKGYVSIPQNMTLGQESSSNGLEVCEMFSRYFASVFDNTASDTSNEKTINESYSKNVLSTITITIEDIMIKIKELDKNKCAGPDGIPPSFIKSCQLELVTPLHIIFTKSLRSGTFPKVWKTAHIIPVFKSGDKSNCKDYRPISILSCIAKLFESLVYEHLYNHVKPYLSDNQHGFVKNKSTITNLLEYKQFLCSSFASSGQVDSIYMDFSKAFDKVNHKILYRKISSFGVHGSLLRWIGSYLQNRSQLVALKGYISTSISVTSGVPQGSHLGPLMFILFINDLVDHIYNPCLLYADDLKIFTNIYDIRNCIKLQSDLMAVQKWCEDNSMQLNAKKCVVISFTKKRHKIIYDYTINNITLERKVIVKDLGILFDSELSFRSHYDYIVERGRKLLGFIIRSTKNFKKERSLIYLYSTLIRSILEYGCQVWSPFYQVHIKNIDNIQNKMLKVLSYRCNLGRSLTNYTQRLEKFNMISLESRRKILDLKLLHKILHYAIKSPALLQQLNINCFTRTRLYKTFSLKVYKNNTSFYNPISRMCRLYNDLSLKHQELDIFERRPSAFIKIIREIIPA